MNKKIRNMTPIFQIKKLQRERWISQDKGVSHQFDQSYLNMAIVKVD